MNQEEIVAELMTLRAQTRMTGYVFEAQTKQLEIWPCGAVSHAASSEVSFETDEEGRDRKVFIEFKLNPRKKAPSNLRKRFEVLEKNVQWLLGNDWKVVMIADGKTVYTGRRRAEPRPQPRKATSGRKR